MTLDPLFIATNRLYEQRAAAMRQRIGRRLHEAEVQKAWLDAAEQAHCEIAEQQQIDAPGADNDAWIKTCESIKAKQEVTRSILDRRAAAGMCDSDEMTSTMNEVRAAISAQIDKAMADTQAAREIEFSDQHDD